MYIYIFSLYTNIQQLFVRPSVCLSGCLSVCLYEGAFELKIWSSKFSLCLNFQTKVELYVENECLYNQNILMYVFRAIVSVQGRNRQVCWGAELGTTCFFKEPSLSGTCKK